jgi:hypothetical protein
MSFSDSETVRCTASLLDAIRFPFPVFDGYPYLVTRLMPNVRHFLLLPGNASATDLREAARHQVQANRLPTALVLDDDFCLYLGADGTEKLAPACAGTARTSSDWLHPVHPFPASAELARRTEQLDAFLGADYQNRSQWEWTAGGRPVPSEDREWLAAQGPDGVPHGLVCCPACGEWRGEGLGSGEASDYLVPVYCRCQNWNRCAECGGPLAEMRLNAYSYNRATRVLDYMPGYKVHWHDCREWTPATHKHFA